MHIHICRSIGFRGVRNMKCRLTEMRRKEVISAVDGARIGYVDDILLETKSAKIVAFVIFGIRKKRGFYYSVGEYTTDRRRRGDRLVSAARSGKKAPKMAIFREKLKFFEFFTIRRILLVYEDNFVNNTQRIIS